MKGAEAHYDDLREEIVEERNEEIFETKPSVRRLSLFDTLENNENEKSVDAEIEIQKSEPTFHEKVPENIEETAAEEFSAEESNTDEEFNQEVEEELLDIPTFLRRQAN